MLRKKRLIASNVPLKISYKFCRQIIPILKRFEIILYFFFLVAEEIKFDAITPDVVKKEKSFIKLTKKHQKELDSLRKKHQKERTIVQKNQCTAIEKLVKCKGK